MKCDINFMSQNVSWWTVVTRHSEFILLIEFFLQDEQQIVLCVEYYKHHFGEEICGYDWKHSLNGDLYCPDLYTPVNKLYNCEFVITTIHSTQVEVLTGKLASEFWLELLAFPFPFFISCYQDSGIINSELRIGP